MTQKKIPDILSKGAKSSLSVNVYFNRDKYYYNLIPLKICGDMVLAARDSDFLLDGYLIFPLSAVEKANKKGKKYNEILAKEGINKNIPVPEIDISSVSSVCSHFAKSGETVSVETIGGEYYLGRIIKAGKKSMVFAWFDARGKWYDPVKIKYRELWLLSYKGRYGEIFARYADKYQEKSYEI